ncbi:hypothetical protein LINPERHAP1_LOCUS24290 [Linum perenne]
MSQITLLLVGIGYNYSFGRHNILPSDSNLSYFLCYDCIGVDEPRLILIND